MNKKYIKYIIIIIVIILLILSGIFILNYFLSLRDVSINFQQQDITINIYNSSEKLQKTISNNQTIKLSKGGYYYIPDCNNCSNNKINFTVDNNMSLTINPDYSENYLSQLLSQEKNIIENLLQQKYPDIINNYEKVDDKLYQKGEWYSAKLIQKIGDQLDYTPVYRLIFHKNNNNWEMVVTPRMIIAKKDFPNIPINIIDDVNLPVN